MSKDIQTLLQEKEFERKIEKLAKLYPQERTALLAALHLCESEIGYIPVEFQEYIAEKLHLSKASIKGVVTFYEMFHEKPKGRYLIQVCKTLPCMLAGAEVLLEHISERLGTKPGQTTKDGKFTLVTVECLACCDKGPAVMINETLHTRLTPEGFDRVIGELE
jgi:NADH-quinone oxidoreductase subunit E